MESFSTEQLPLIPKDGEDLSIGVQEGGRIAGDDHSTVEVKSLSRQILAQRATRLQKQNEVLDFQLQKQREQFGDIAQFIRDVQRMNEVVKNSLYSMAARIAEPLAGMTDPGEIRDFLRAQLRDAFNDLAHNHAEHGATDT